MFCVVTTSKDKVSPQLSDTFSGNIRTAISLPHKLTSKKFVFDNYLANKVGAILASLLYLMTC